MLTPPRLPLWPRPTGIHRETPFAVASQGERRRPGSHHGGWVDEGFAALVGLALNVRCRSGGLWRDFRGKGGGGRGNPYLGSFEPPTLVPPKGAGLGGTSSPHQPGSDNDAGENDKSELIQIQRASR